MARRYIHSGAELQNNAYLERLGFEVLARPRQTVKPKPCPHCNKLNPYTNANCDACGMPLELAKYKEVLEKKHLETVGFEGLKEEMQRKMNEMQKQLDEMNNKWVQSSEDAKKVTLELVRNFVASNNPTYSQLKQFLTDRRIPITFLEEVKGIIPHNGQWYFSGSQSDMQ